MKKFQKRPVVQNEPFFRETDNGIEFYYRGYGALPVYSKAMAIRLINMFGREEEKGVKEKAESELKLHSEWFHNVATADNLKGAEEEIIELVEEMRRSEQAPPSEVTIREGVRGALEHQLNLQPEEEDTKDEIGEIKGGSRGKARN